MFRDNFQSLTKLGVCFTGRFDQYQTPNVKIKFFDLSIINHTPVIFKDYSQLLTFCLQSSKLNFCYTMLGMLVLHCVVNKPWYYVHRSLGSAFSGCLPHWDLSNITKTKKVDTDHYLSLFCPQQEERLSSNNWAVFRLGLENTVLGLASQLWSDVLLSTSMEETILPPVE